jgi:hypothetical protein
MVKGELHKKQNNLVYKLWTIETLEEEHISE